jgi:hypothetical protein
MKNWLLSTILCFVIFTGTVRADEVSLTWESCIALDTVVTKSGVCYVKDLVKADGYWEVTVGFGVNVNAGAVVVGGGGSALLVAKAKIDGASNKETTLRKLKQYVDTLPLDTAAKKEIIEKVKPVLGRNPASVPRNATKQSGVFQVEEVSSSSAIGKAM